MYICRSSHQRCSLKKVFLEISQSSQENTCARVSFFNKVAGLACNFIKKEALAHVFSCEFREISKNTFFTEHLWLTASDFIHLKGAMKLYFTRCSCVLIILFNTSLSRFAFSTISFRKLVFRLSVLSAFFVLSKMFWTKTLIRVIII